MNSRHMTLSKGKATGFRAHRIATLCLAVAGCGYQTPLPDTALAPPGAFGSNGDEDIAAVNLASWAFSSSRNTCNHPIEAARSIAAVDYLAGELNSNPRWIGISPLVQMEMLQARAQVRSVMGIAPNARSQLVVNSLSGYAAVLAATGNQAQAAPYLANPAFTLGPLPTEAKLENLPFMSLTNIATQRAAASVGNGTGTNENNLP